MPAFGPARGRDSGRGQVVKWLSSNGRPVALLSRHPDPAHVRGCPSTRIPSPSHAAAAACLPTSGPPAFGTLRAARSRTTLRTTTWCAATPECSPAGAVSRARGSLAVGGMPPSARYRECGVPCLCDASTAYAALSQRGTVWHHPVPSHAGLFVPAKSPVATVIAGHLNTASSCRHQENV